MNNINTKPKQAEGIDFGKWISEDDLNEVQCNLKGLIAVLQSMSIAEDGGQHKFSAYALDLIAKTISSVDDDIDKLKPDLDYMDDIARYGVEYANTTRGIKNNR